MCNPMIAMAAVTVAQQVAQFSAQSSAAKAEKQYNEKLDAQALKSLNFQNNALSRREMAEKDKAAQEKFTNQTEAAKRAASVAAANEQTGLGGFSLDNLIDDVYRQQGRIDDVSVRNADYATVAIRDEMEGNRLAYEGRTMHAPISKPSLLGLGLGIAGAGAKAWAQYDEINNPNRKKD